MVGLWSSRAGEKSRTFTRLEIAGVGWEWGGLSTLESLHWLPRTQCPEELRGKRKHFQKGVRLVGPSLLSFSWYMVRWNSACLGFARVQCMRVCLSAGGRSKRGPYSRHLRSKGLRDSLWTWLGLSHKGPVLSLKECIHGTGKITHLRTGGTRGP